MPASNRGDISVNGPIFGIGNVIGHGSQSHVQVKIVFAPFSRLTTQKNAVKVEINPHYTEPDTPIFSDHPDAPTNDEVHHLIGQRLELERLSLLYGRMKEQSRGAIVFITGRNEFGARGLGRTFVDMVRRGGGTTAITRFWPQGQIDRNRRDQRWSELLKKHRQSIKEDWPPPYRSESQLPLQSLLVQMLENQAIAQRAALLPEDLAPDKLATYFASLATPTVPLLLLLEDFQNADPSWIDLLHTLAGPIQRDLPILIIATIEADQPVSDRPADQLVPAESLVLDLSRLNLAETYYLSRAATREEIADYLMNADSAVIQTLTSITQGIPLLVENLWREWRVSGHVIEKRGRWSFRPGSPWIQCKSALEYINHMLDQTWRRKEAGSVYLSGGKEWEILACAALEGLDFTVDALAAVFNLPARQLDIAFEYLLDEPDDPGLVIEAAPANISLPEANLHRRLTRYRFRPSIVWHYLNQYRVCYIEAPTILRLADQLELAYSPFMFRIAGTLSRLYQLAGQDQKARWYQNIITPPNPFQPLLAELNILRTQPSLISRSRMLFLMVNLANLGFASASPMQALDLFKEMLKTAADFKNKEMMGIACYQLGYASFELTRYQQAAGYYQQALGLFRGLGNEAGVADCLEGLGHFAHSQGQHNQARINYEQALEIYRRLDREAGVADCLHGLGQVTSSYGHYDQARAYYQQALDIHCRLGREAGASSCLSGLGQVASHQGHYDQARAYYQQALQIDLRLGHEADLAICLEGLGHIAIEQGQYDQARTYYQQALEIYRRFGSEASVADCLHGLGFIADSYGHYDQARTHYEQALEIHRRLGREEVVASHLHGLGNVAHNQGQYDQARTYYQQSLESYRRLGGEANMGVCLYSLGNLAHDQGQYDQAGTYYQQALEINRRLRSESGMFVCLFGLGRVAQSQGQYDQARILYQQALEIAQRINPDPKYTKNMQNALEKLKQQSNNS